jgi:uncharacterized protein (DUF302 family)
MSDTERLSVRLSVPYEEALGRVKDALKTEGFGVLTEIDMKSTLREKLDVDFRKYTIIGACNPPLAHKALTADLEVGLLLPCNVVVYEDDGESVVTAFDPESAFSLIENAELATVAEDAKARLQRALGEL